MFVLRSYPLHRHKQAVGLAALFLASFFAASSALAQVPPARDPFSTLATNPFPPVWTETFSSGNPPLPVSLASYTGVGGEGYFANADWLPGFNACNGWILNSATAAPPVNGANGDSGCSGANGDGGVIVINNAPTTGTGANRAAWLYLQRMAYQLGVAQGDPDPAHNDVLASMTNAGVSQTNSIQFATNSPPAPISVTEGHFYIGSVWVAEVHCSTEASGRGWANSSETFSLLVGGATEQLLSGYSPCSLGAAPAGSQSLVHDGAAVNRAGDLHVSQMLTPGWLAPNNTTVGVQIENTTTDFHGNDVALDTPQLLDATPQLYKSFNPAPTTSSDYTIGPSAGGEVVKMTFIIVNTTDLQKKAGWSFTDDLPADGANQLEVASPPNISSTCATVTGPGGAALAGGEISIEVTGALAAGDATCTVSVDVLAPNAVGTYKNEPTNLKNIIGLVNPNTAILHIAGLIFNKTADVNDPSVPGTPDVLQAGDTITYTFTVTNDSGSDIVGLVINELGFTGKGGMGSVDMSDCKSKFDAGDLGTGVGGTRLSDGATLSCKGIYTVTQDDMDDLTLNEITNTAEAKPTTGNPSPPSSVTVPVDKPALTLLKTASTNQLVAGNTVTFLFRIQNTGNVILSDVHIDEVRFTGSTPLPSASVICPPGDLGIGAVITCTADYTVTTADVAAGVITNEADAAGTVMGISRLFGTTIPLESITSQHSIVRLSSPAPIPTLDARMLVLLALLLGGLVAGSARRRVWK